MAGARTVTLSHLAAERPGPALIASTYRRLQRFFQYVRLGRDWAAPIAAELSGLTGSWYLALDRTQWRIGAREVNFLVLAAVTRRFRVPLMWTVIPSRGNSSTQQRIALMRRYLKLFDLSTIRLLLADREFKACPREGGGPRLDRFSLQKQHPLRHPPARRPAHHHRGGPWDHARRPPALAPADQAFQRLARHRPRARQPPPQLRRQAAPERRVDRHRHQPHAPSGTRRISPALGHRVSVRRRQDPRPQPRGHPPLRPAQARPADGPRRPRLAWAARAARDLLGTRWPRRKAHGYLAKSWFRIGFDQIRYLLRSDPLRAIQPWLRIAPKHIQISRVV